MRQHDHWVGIAFQTVCDLCAIAKCSTAESCLGLYFIGKFLLPIASAMPLQNEY